MSLGPRASCADCKGGSSTSEHETRADGNAVRQTPHHGKSHDADKNGDRTGKVAGNDKWERRQAVRAHFGDRELDEHVNNLGEACGRRKTTHVATEKTRKRTTTSANKTETRVVLLAVVHHGAGCGRGRRTRDAV